MLEFYLEKEILSVIHLWITARVQFHPGAYNDYKKWHWITIVNSIVSSMSATDYVQCMLNNKQKLLDERLASIKPNICPKLQYITFTSQTVS